MPGWHHESSPGWFSATFKCTPITQMIIDMLVLPEMRRNVTEKMPLPQRYPALTAPLSFDDPPEIELLKYDTIGLYFSCVSCLVPVLVPSYFLDILLSDTNGMLSNAVAACVVNSRCKHLNMEGIVYGRAELGGMFLERAHNQLQDALFDEEEPTLEIAATLHLLSASYMSRFDLRNAKLMSDLAWRMINQLRMPCFDKYDKDKNDSTAMIRAETWRRLFYSIRAFELNKCELQINTASLESIVWASRDVGCPEPLPDEANDPVTRASIEVYQCIVSLKTWSRINAITVDEQILRSKLCCSTVEKILVSNLESIQRHIMEFWYRIPEKYRFTDIPIGEDLDMDRVRQCTDPKVLYLNIFYYRCWLHLEMRFMTPPETTDMTSTSLARTDRERCILIVSYACDAVATLTLALHRLKPCVTETHHIAIVADVLLMLTKSTNKEIRERAQAGLHTLMFVLSDSTGAFDRTQMEKPALWSHSLYVVNLKQVVETYFESYISSLRNDISRWPDLQPNKT
ncbi:hypothetical protein BX666DRAFT_1875272 [Dichotomocladium elegans]|nr:hypothetical protein BX666DRAFT_1875272 [Dichotomocladium elegans]